MRLRTLSLVAGTSFVLALAMVIAAGCGSRPGSPEQLFARIAELNAAGETGKIWDLLTDDARQREMKAIDGLRVTVARNPGAEGLVKQYKCTKDEFMTLSYVELYRRENLGNERALVDAKITDKHADPAHPGDQFLTIENPLGGVFHMRVRPVAGGWGIVEMSSSQK